MPCHKKSDLNLNHQLIGNDMKKHRSPRHKVITRIVSIAALFIFTVLVPGTFGVEQPQLEAKSIEPGEHLCTLKVGDLNRHYIVHLPPKYDGISSFPAVIIFHGGGGTARGMMLESSWLQKADGKNFLAVFPDATPPDTTKPSRFMQNGQVWNDGSGRFHAGQKDIPDVAFINAVLDELIARFKVNRRRIYATGFSNGASMTFRVGIELSARIAAIAPVAGALWIKQPKIDQPVSLYYITGAADPLNPLEGGVPKFATGSTLRGLSSRRKPAVRENVVVWSRLLDCQSEPRVISAVPGVTTEVYSGGRDGSEVRFTVIKDHGHIWPGGRNRLPESLVGQASDKFKATDAIWEFFEKHTLPKRE